MGRVGVAGPSTPEPGCAKGLCPGGPGRQELLRWRRLACAGAAAGRRCWKLRPARFRAAVKRATVPGLGLRGGPLGVCLQHDVLGQPAAKQAPLQSKGLWKLYYAYI